MFDEQFILKYVTGGNLALWNGYSIRFILAHDTWRLFNPADEKIMEGTLDECAEYYVDQQLAVR